MLKDKECSKNSHTEYNLRYSMQSTVFFSFNYMPQKVHFLCVTHTCNPKETMSKTFVNHVERNVLLTGINCSAFN